MEGIKKITAWVVLASIFANFLVMPPKQVGAEGEEAAPPSSPPSISPPTPSVLPGWSIAMHEKGEVITYKDTGVEANFYPKHYGQFLIDGSTIETASSIWGWKPSPSVDRTIDIMVAYLYSTSSATTIRTRIVQGGFEIKNSRDQNDCLALDFSSGGIDYTTIDGKEIKFCPITLASHNQYNKMVEPFSTEKQEEIKKVFTSNGNNPRHSAIATNRGSETAPSDENINSCSEHLIIPLTHPGWIDRVNDGYLRGKFKENFTELIDQAEGDPGTKQEFKKFLDDLIKIDSSLTDFISKNDDYDNYRKFYNSHFNNTHDSITVGDIPEDGGSRFGNIPTQVNYPNIAITNDLLFTGLIKQGESFHTLAESFPEAYAPSWKPYAIYGALAAIAAGITIVATGGTALLAIGAGAALGLTHGSMFGYLTNGIAQIRDPGVRQNKFNELIKEYIKAYVIGEYAYSNYRFNRCLQDKNDPYAWVNPSVMQALSDTLHPTLDMGDYTCGCDDAYGKASAWNITNSIKGAICSLLCQTFIFVQARFNNAVETLGDVIGVNLGPPPGTSGASPI